MKFLEMTNQFYFFLYYQEKYNNKYKTNTKSSSDQQRIHMHCVNDR